LTIYKVSFLVLQITFLQALCAQVSAARAVPTTPLFRLISRLFSDRKVLPASTSSDQCCQVAEIPAKKLKSGRGEKSWPKESMTEFPNFAKSGRKGAEENRVTKFLFSILTNSQRQHKI
jgi:hypothetical protein